MRMTIHVGPRVAEQGQIRLWLAREYLEAIQIQQIVPEPADVVSDGTGMTYVFQVADSSAPITVSVDFVVEQFGLKTVRIQADEWPPLRFRQLIYP